MTEEEALKQVRTFIRKYVDLVENAGRGFRFLIKEVKNARIFHIYDDY